MDKTEAEEEACKYPWLRYDGTELWPNGALIKADLTNWVLYEYKDKDPYPNSAAYIDQKEAVQRFDASPVFMVLGLDAGETFYKVLADDKPYWIAVAGCSLVQLATD